MAKERIWLSSPHMGGDEIKFVQEAFDTNWVAPVGPHITAFEEELAHYNDIGYCAALSSGTAAIQLALIVLGVERDDEIICSTFTFAGSCNPIIYVGARPVFIDSDLETWNMNPVLLEEAIQDRIKKTGRKPKAIIVVHLYGMPARMNEIMNIANRYEIPVIEDAAEALGSTYNGKKLGTIGQIGVFSFNGNKIITTSGGGAIVSNNKDWISKMRFLATQARDPAPHYEHSAIGYNYRLSNVCAGIGRGQMKVLNTRIAQRRANFEYYKRTLSHHQQVGFVAEMQGMFSNRWLTTITIKDAGNENVTSQLREALERENIESRPVWKPMHLQPVFSDVTAFTNGVSEDLFRSGLCLPSGSNLTPHQLEEIVDKINTFMVTIG